MSATLQCGEFVSEQTVWRRGNAEERVRAAEILTMSLEIVKLSGDNIRTLITVHHEYICVKCVDSGTQCDACEALLCNTCDVDATERGVMPQFTSEFSTPEP